MCRLITAISIQALLGHKDSAAVSDLNQRYPISDVQALLPLLARLLVLKASMNA